MKINWIRQQPCLILCDKLPSSHYDGLFLSWTQREVFVCKPNSSAHEHKLKNKYLRAKLWEQS